MTASLIPIPNCGSFISTVIRASVLLLRGRQDRAADAAVAGRPEAA
jgi:hypothetical protein